MLPCADLQSCDLRRRAHPTCNMPLCASLLTCTAKNLLVLLVDGIVLLAQQRGLPFV